MCHTEAAARGPRRKRRMARRSGTMRLHRVFVIGLAVACVSGCSGDHRGSRASSTSSKSTASIAELRWLVGSGGVEDQLSTALGGLRRLWGTPSARAAILEGDPFRRRLWETPSARAAILEGDPFRRSALKSDLEVLARCPAMVKALGAAPSGRTKAVDVLLATACSSLKAGAAGALRGVTQIERLGPHSSQADAVSAGRTVTLALKRLKPGLVFAREARSAALRLLSRPR
jgi:hypothetical protein